MPIASGAKGMPGVLAIPGRSRTGSSAPRSIKQGAASVGARIFRSQPLNAVNPRITGITKDSVGAAIGSCSVHLFRTADDLEMDMVTSDATTGYYSVCAVGPGPFYVVAYKAGAPDVAGTTVNTLLATS